MVLETWQAQGGVALLGGFAAETLHWYLLSRRPGGVPKSYKTGLVYWASTLGMIALGGIMPLLYIDGSAGGLLCFHLGASTPLILQKLISSVPKATAHLGADETSLRDFFKW